MPRLIFRELIWNAHDYEWSEEGHAVSIANFDFESHGLMHRGLSARILQPEGEPDAPPRIFGPSNYDGEIDLEAFRLAAADYYLKAARAGLRGDHAVWAKEVEYLI